MRIIGGKFKGKKLLLPIDKKTRPLKDLVKESIFNLIENSNKYKIFIQNSAVLDLFSGSGSFGLECISRGVEKIVFSENYPSAIKILKRNISKINGDKFSKIIEKNCFDLISSNVLSNQSFDIIFLDPPFNKDFETKILNQLFKKKDLKPSCKIYLEYSKYNDIEIPKEFIVLKEKDVGDVKALLLIKDES